MEERSSFSTPSLFEPANTSGRRLLGPAMALVVFALVQIALALTVDLPEYDEAIYLNVARSIRRSGIAMRSLSGGILYADHTPLYQYFLGLSTSLLGERIQLLRLLTVLFGVGCVVLVYDIDRRLRGPLAGLAATLILALNPFFNFYAFFLRAELPMLFFILLSAYWLARYEAGQQTRMLSWAGLSAAVAFLLRENALLFSASATLFVMLTTRTWRGRLRNGARVGGPSLAAILLWLGWLLLLNPASLESTVNRYLASAAGSGTAIFDARVGQELSTWLNIVTTEVIGPETLLLLVGALLAYLVWRPPMPRFTLLVGLYLGLLAAYALLVSLREPRHLIPAIPMLALLIALLIDWSRLLAWLRSRRFVRNHPRVSAIIAVLLVLILAWSLLPVRLPSSNQWSNPEQWWDDSYQGRMFTGDRIYGILRPVGVYLKQASPPDETIVVVHQGTVVGYYADRPYDFLYTKNFQGIMRVLAEADFLIYDQPSFFRLSLAEVEAVESYISEQFEVDRTFRDEYREVKVYRERSSD